jgi:3-phosphoglycerate kinase
LQGTILKKIQESCRYSIKENLDEGKKSLLPYLNNYSPMKGVFVNGAMNDFEFEKVEITNKAIIAFITTTGKMSVKIDGME